MSCHLDTGATTADRLVTQTFLSVLTVLPTTLGRAYAASHHASAVNALGHIHKQGDTFGVTVPGVWDQPGLWRVDQPGQGMAYALHTKDKHSPPRMLHLPGQGNPPPPPPPLQLTAQPGSCCGCSTTLWNTMGIVPKPHSLRPLHLSPVSAQRSSYIELLVFCAGKG